MIAITLPMATDGQQLRSECRAAEDVGAEAIVVAPAPLGPWDGPAATAAYVAGATSGILGVGLEVGPRHGLEVAEEATVVRAIAGPRTWVVLIGGTARQADEVRSLLAHGSELTPSFPTLSIPLWWAPVVSGTTGGFPILLPAGEGSADGLYGSPAELRAAAEAGARPSVWLIVPDPGSSLEDLAPVVTDLRKADREPSWLSIAMEGFDADGE